MSGLAIVLEFYERMSRTSNGFVWSFIERFLSQGANFVISIILARLIAPESYGLIVMVNIFITFSNLFIEGGFSKALIQKLNRSDEDYNTVFYFNFVLSLFLYLLLYFGAPYISSFYNQQKLVLITRLLGLNLIVGSFSVVPRAILNIKLDFLSLSRVSLVSIIISGLIGVIMAYQGFEVWALVSQSILCQLLMSIGLLWKFSWNIKMQFSYKSFKELFGYGSKLLINGIVSSMYVEGTNLFIGKIYNSAQLAFYNTAFTLAQFPSTNIVGILNRVSFPLECEKQDSKQELKEVYYRNLHLSNFICFPLLVILAILSDSIIKIVLTEKWLPSALYLSLFSINFIPYASLNEMMNIISAVGRSDIILKGTIYRRIISFVILFISIFYGVKAICLGLIISSFIEIFIMALLVKKTLGYGIGEYLKKLLDIIISCIIMSVLIYLCKFLITNIYLQVFLGVFISIALYLLMARVFNMYEFEFINNKISQLLKR